MKSSNHSLHLCISAFLFVLLNSSQLPSQTTFTDITEQAGISHQFGVLDGFLGGGVCVIDINNDGFQDLYLTGGKKSDRLYLNNGNGTFKDIYPSSGMTLTSDFVTQGVAGADVNKDGWTDLFITTNSTMDSTQQIPRAKNLFFLNKGDNTFREATSEYGLDPFNSFSTGISFGDFNADGYPDAYVANYFHEYEGPLNEISDATIVNANNTAKGYLLLNIKGKKFKNVYADYGLRHKGFGFGGLFTDFDNDGDQDLLVNHDFGYKATPNYLLQNNYPKKGFTYIEKEKEMDIRINAMTSAVGDYDNNGWLDYFITNIRFNYFMVNQGPSLPFVNRSKELGTKLFKIGWGANFADFDNDGDLDLFVSNGDLNPNCHPFNNFYFENKNYSFTEMGSAVGLNDYGIGRGSVVFDIENDGDMDLLVVNQTPVMQYPVPSNTLLYRNDTPKKNWLKVKLKGSHATTKGLGARIKLVAGELQQIREVDGGGSSHLSQNSTVVHFGLDTLAIIDTLSVSWIGGEEQIRNQVAINQLITIEQPPKEESNFSFYILGLLLSLSLVFLISRFYGSRAR